LKQSLVIFQLFIGLSAFAQVKTDSIRTLKQVDVIYCSFSRDLTRATGAENLILLNQIKNQAQSSLVGAANTVPGVRMEERSPGSYRLSLRGSLLRSPFGIRNVKIYIDEFPLTDAGGNTYLNLIDPGTINSLSIFKGPQSSIFGANTGGAILVNTGSSLFNLSEANVEAGSYGLFHQTANVKRTYEKYDFNVSEGYQQSDGYRENSALKRKYFQTSHQWRYSDKGSAKLFAFYSDLSYETPGGLTEAQLLANPKAARPATATLPGAIDQQAGIYNKTFFGGLSNNYFLNPDLQFVVALFGNHTDFKNPFITNFEKRKENTFGLRSFLSYNNNRNIYFRYNINAGIESSRTTTAFNNYGNNKGTAAALQASDDLKAKQDFIFVKTNVDINDRLILELGASLNFFGYNYQSNFPIVTNMLNRSFKKELMPKFAASYRLVQNLHFRSSVSKGYSPPTLAEVRASDNVINTNLQAEAGWNYEAGLNYKSNRLTVSGGLFYFHLKDAIVRRLTPLDAEYFINAGGTKQLGTELLVSYALLTYDTNRFLKAFNLNSSYTYSHFRFEDFKNVVQDFSGHSLTGVPKNTVVSSLELLFPKNLFLFVQHNYTSTIPLNDANTVYAKKYHLADLKMGIRDLALNQNNKSKFDLSFGINNIFDQNYSLGNDLNAANNRYYNPSAKRNYSFGVGVNF
jgi:iron complex outermembrane receptor protein